MLFVYVCLGWTLTPWKEQAYWGKTLLILKNRKIYVDKALEYSFPFFSPKSENI